MGWISGLFGLLGNAISGLFNFKAQQGEVVKQALQTVSDVSATNAARERAISDIIASEASSQFWLTACWRPLLMLIFAGIIVSSWFGYVPPHMGDTMSPMLARIFDLMELGMGGYIGGRTIEKIATQVNLAGVLKAYINKKVT
jgi:hypothetical protein